MALAIPIFSGDLAHNVYGVTLFPTMIGYGWLRVLPWALAIMNLAHESDYNDARQQNDLFIGLWRDATFGRRVSLYLSSKN